MRRRQDVDLDAGEDAEGTAGLRTSRLVVAQARFVALPLRSASGGKLFGELVGASRMRLAWARARVSSRPLVMARFLEWSVMAMYSRPRAMAASAISRMVLRPSVSVVCMCRSPRMSPRVMSVRQRVVGGGFDFAAVLAQLGRNVVEVERVVDLLLGGGGDDRVVFEAEQSVLAEREAAFDGALAQGDVVHLGAGEVLQRRSVAGARQQADVDLEIVAEGEGDLVLAFGEELVDERKGGDVLDGGGDDVGLAGGAGDEQVEVADGLAAAAQRAGGGDRLDAGERADERADALGVLAGVVDAEARGVVAVVLDALEELGGELLAHARQGEQVAALGGRFERVDVGDPSADQTSATVFGPMPGRRRSSSMVGL